MPPLPSFSLTVNRRQTRAQSYGLSAMRELTRRQFLGTAAGLSETPLLSVLPAASLAVHPRSEWATNRPPRGKLVEEDVRFLLVHHSASRNGHTSADAPAILRSFYDFHTGPERGWIDIAYNFLIDAGGEVWEGRAGSLDGPVVGDATGGNQGFSQLVCVIGDYNTAQPTQASLTTLVALLAWLADGYRLDTGPNSQVTFTSRGSNVWPSGTSVTTPIIAGHRSMSRTSCPGANLTSYVEGELMADVTRARSRRAASVSRPGSQSSASSAPLLLAQESSSTGAPGDDASDLVPVITSTTTTTTPPTPPPTSSPLILVASGIAVLATLIAAWRARRMQGN